MTGRSLAALLCCALLMVVVGRAHETGHAHHHPHHADTLGLEQDEPGAAAVLRPSTLMASMVNPDLFEVVAVETDMFDALSDGHENAEYAQAEWARSTVQLMQAGEPMHERRQQTLNSDNRQAWGLRPGRLHKHPEQSRVRVQALGLDHTLQLHKNHQLFAPTYVEKLQAYEDGQLLSEEVVRQGMRKAENCHYQGDGAAVSTCDGGLSGEFLHQGEWYVLEPAHHHLTPAEVQAHVDRLNEGLDVEWLARQKTSSSRRRRRKAASVLVANPRNLHIVYRDDAYVQAAGGRCGVGMHDHQAETSGHSHSGTFRSGAVGARTETRAMGNAAVPGRRQQQTLSNKYVELFVVNDYARMTHIGPSKFDNESHVLINAAGLVNRVDNLYKNSVGLEAYRVILVGQVGFTVSDPWGYDTSCGSCGAGEVGVDQLLSDFNAWGRVGANHGVSHDNRQLFSNLDFESGVLGYAGVGVMCFGSSTGGIDETRSTDTRNAAVIAHEMGHNFGSQHDSSGNSCPESGFIMNAVLGVTPSTFSDCSVDYITDYVAGVTCLNNVPTTSWAGAACGNGVVEEGEDCDCGDDDCSTADPCCDGLTCEFLPGKNCSALDACCDPTTCSIKAAGSEVCRDAVGPCDLEETCDGVSGRCPSDVYKGPGTDCVHGTYGSGKCFQGVCMSHLRQCREDGSGFVGAPWDECPSQSSLNSGDFCDTLWCQTNPPSCSFFSISGLVTKTSDGVPCGSNRQCLSGSCVSSALLAAEFTWATGDWSTCTECSQTVTRDVYCVDSSDNVVVDEACSQTGIPSTSGTCTNETLGCASKASSSDTLSLFGYEVATNTLIFVALGAAAFFIILVVCCYKAVTFGGEEIFVRHMDQRKLEARQAARAADYDAGS